MARRGSAARLAHILEKTPLNRICRFGGMAWKADMRLIPIKVECYAGAKADETPRRFIWQGRPIEVGTKLRANPSGPVRTTSKCGAWISVNTCSNTTWSPMNGTWDKCGEEIAECIKTTGLQSQKARHLKNLCAAIVKGFGSEAAFVRGMQPTIWLSTDLTDRDDLRALPSRVD
jgi:hypothetical protein